LADALPAATVSWYEPATVLACSVTVSLPFASVVYGPASTTETEAPEAGGVKVTDAPGTAWLTASKTVNDSWVGKSEPTVVLCPSPAVTETVAGGPMSSLVSVPTPCASTTFAPETLVTLTKKVSSDSKLESPLTVTSKL
jgi:hypothetical protein